MRRTPIYLNSHAIALLTIYEKPLDDVEDVWSWGLEMAAQNGKDASEAAAEQFCEQLTKGGNCSARLLMEVRKSLLRELMQNDAEHGSGHAAASIAEDMLELEKRKV